MTGHRLESALLWQQPDGLWRWRWVCPEPGEELEEASTSLVSFKAFESVDEAEASAKEAYPGITVYRARGNRRSWSPARLLLVAALLGLAVLRNLTGRRPAG